MSYDERHGSPYDRGRADAYYGRGYEPHYYQGDTYSSPRVSTAEMTKDQMEAYTAGYHNQIASNEFKDWGEFSPS